MAKNNPWKQKSKSYVYETPWLKVRRDEVIQPNGEHSTYSFIDSKPFVMILPYDNGNFYLVEQFRYPISRWTLEFPSGGIVESETFENAVRRELKEEVGFEANTITKLGELHESAGIIDASFPVYVAQDFTPIERKLDASEHGLTVRKLTEAEVKESILNGVITNSPSVAAFLLYLLKKNA